MIVTANNWFEVNLLTFRSGRLRKNMERMGIKGGDQGPDMETKPLVAWVSRGRWSVTCPCGGGEYAWEEGWVMCQSCFNSYISHKLRKTIFPKQRQQIEELLELRPLDNRHWVLGETLKDLERENVEHSSELLVKGG